jgi:hypothetical protein
MKTRALTNDSGVITGFSVGSARLTRWGVPKIIRSIPGARLVRTQRSFRLAGPDDFCEFVVDGQTFLVIEQFGDNSEFWVVAEPPEPECPPLAKVRSAFESYRGLFGFFAG